VSTINKLRDQDELTDLQSPFCVSSFFQEETEEALIAQVRWLEEHLGTSDSFFAKMLCMEQGRFFAWKIGRASLSEDELQQLRAFWRVVLHLLAFSGFDYARMRQMLEHRSEESKRETRLPFDPPWLGTSPKQYLEVRGICGVHEIDRWVQRVRFGNSF
jgi:hypothetical protein